MISQWQFLFPNNDVDAVLMKITEKVNIWKTSFFGWWKPKAQQNTKKTTEQNQAGANIEREQRLKQRIDVN